MNELLASVKVFMIGIFDSGFGGLAILRRLVDDLPMYDYVYFGDNARAPYGSRSQDEIYTYTLQGVEDLFNKGCPLVVLACNTASAAALRRIQQEVLPRSYPERRVLGVIVPTIEMLIANGVEKVTVLGTSATVQSHAYALEIAKRHPGICVTERACPNLAPLIERGAPLEVLREEVRSCVEQLLDPPQTLLLGCTHYELVHDLFTLQLPKAAVINQSPLIASSLRSYLDRHPEIHDRLSKMASRTFLTTGDPERVNRIGARFFGSEVQFAHVPLPRPSNLPILFPFKPPTSHVPPL